MEGTVWFLNLKVRRGSAVVFGTPGGGSVVVHAAPVTRSTVAVAIDVGKNEFAVSVTDAARSKLLKPRLGCPMTGPSVRAVVDTIQRLLPPDAAVKIGIEAPPTVRIDREEVHTRIQQEQATDVLVAVGTEAGATRGDVNTTVVASGETGVLPHHVTEPTPAGSAPQAPQLPRPNRFRPPRKPR